MVPSIPYGQFIPVNGNYGQYPLSTPAPMPQPPASGITLNIDDTKAYAGQDTGQQTTCLPPAILPYPPLAPLSHPANPYNQANKPPDNPVKPPDTEKPVPAKPLNEDKDKLNKNHPIADIPRQLIESLDDGLSSPDVQTRVKAGARLAQLFEKNPTYDNHPDLNNFVERELKDPEQNVVLMGHLAIGAGAQGTKNTLNVLKKLAGLEPGAINEGPSLAQQSIIKLNENRAGLDKFTPPASPPPLAAAKLADNSGKPKDSAKPIDKKEAPGNFPIPQAQTAAANTPINSPVPQLNPVYSTVAAANTCNNSSILPTNPVVTAAPNQINPNGQKLNLLV